MELSDLKRVQIELLLGQQRAALAQASALARLMAVVSVLGFGLLILIGQGTLSQRAALPAAEAWAAPLVFLVIFAAWIGLAAQQVAAAWQGRILAAQARRLAGEALPLPASTDPLNVWRSDWKLRLLVAVPVILAGVAYLGVLFLGLRSVYDANHLQALAYAVLFGGLTVIVATALLGAARDLPRHYASLYQAAARGEGQAATLEGLPELPRSGILGGLRPLGRWLLPLPGELLRWSWLYLLGFASVPFLGMGLGAGRLDLVNSLFSGATRWETVDKMPAWVILCLGLIGFLVAEGLLQQAAALWEAHRRGLNPLPRPWLQIVGRWLLALLPAWWLGGSPLLALFGVISLYQLVLMVLVMRQAGKRPLLVLLVQALGLPLRFMAGVLVWGDPSWALAVYQALTVVVYLIGLAVLAIHWQYQGLGRVAANQAPLPGDAYFTAHGGFWRYAGLAAALLAGLALFVFQALAEQCVFAPNSFLGDLYAACLAGKPVYAIIGLGHGLLVAFDLLVVALLLGMLLARLLERLQLARQGRLLAALNRLRMVLVITFCLLTLAALIMSVRDARAGWSLAGVVTAIMGLIFL